MNDEINPSARVEAPLKPEVMGIFYLKQIVSRRLELYKCSRPS